ncbi:uncharacterized protein I303_106043 [Kwoniella dejecticola CBS 10117]|uniref:Major facilitator superfamily (MFS) profile domain-containing protein n=1 Tax=Kwoniella dejecticola CBS 10117 TaxID=1296121 RepID=A0A1A6A137_9TREE|nr:uncharacterized protein I303_06063 [Kwoniella dejecticola CBS 10117]OBR83781.1 hypothetical protein I303_06063 [Kwoniella dejecticola CBS 10117]
MDNDNRSGLNIDDNKTNINNDYPPTRDETELGKPLPSERGSELLLKKEPDEIPLQNILPLVPRVGLIEDTDTSSKNASMAETVTQGSEVDTVGGALDYTSGKNDTDNEEVKRADMNEDLACLPKNKKNILLFCFCLSMFIDGAGVSATFLMTAEIARDLSIGVGDQAWILGTYAIAFGSTLLLAGRLADLYSPSKVYSIGFVGIAIFNLIISFMEDKYSFFVLRAISALAAVLTIPSSINMIVQMYPDPTEQTQKLSIYGIAAALSNSVAIILAGLFMLSSWRWYFRFVTIVVAPFAALAWVYMPPTKAVASSLSSKDKIKRLDLIGVVLLLSALVLFILGFTQAESKGWSSAIFLAPFLVSLAMFGVFVFWEARLEEGFGLLPKGIWRFPNIFPLILMAIGINMWFNTAQLRISTYFQDVLGISPILTGVKLLPMGITVVVVGALTHPFPFLILKPRLVLPVCTLACLVGSLLFAFSDGGDGMNYWKFIFPGMIIGVAGGIIGYIAANTCIIQAFPISYAGISGSFANVVFQVGGVVGVAIQSGLLNTGNGTIEDWTGSRNSYFFSGSFVILGGLVMLVFFREKRLEPDQEEV